MSLESIYFVSQMIAAAAVVATLVFLAFQVRTSNRLARAEAYRSSNSELNAINATFGVGAVFQGAMRKVITNAERSQLDEAERMKMDLYMVSLTNIFEQLSREVREGVLDASYADRFPASAQFKSAFYRSSWPLYRQYLSAGLVADFEKKHNLDPSIQAAW